MRPIYCYPLVFLGMLMFLSTLGVFVLLSNSGVGVRMYIEAMRYMSVGGKAALALLAAGTMFFLVEFILAKDRK